MNTNFLRKIFERMHDCTLASAVAGASGDTDGQVSERTVRNWLTKRTTPDPAMLERLVTGSREKLLKTMEANAWPAAEREALAETLDACPGFVSNFAVLLQTGSATYPAFMQRARQIDLLEQALDARRASDDLPGWVKTFLDTDWIQDEHLTNPDDGTNADAIRSLLRSAKSWKDLVLPVSVFVVNVQFELLATLDLEFCAGYLPGWKATPVFASLLPRLNPQAGTRIGTSKITRDVFHYPTRRLLDLTACLRALRYSPGRNWPSAMPTAQEMATWLDLADREKLASNLPKWRSGRTITAERFDDLWRACFDFLPDAERPTTPVPMLYAVTVFTELFVKGSREDRDLTFTAPDPALYQHWWDLQHRKLTSGERPLRFGTREWMPGLT